MSRQPYRGPAKVLKEDLKEVTKPEDKTLEEIKMTHEDKKESKQELSHAEKKAARRAGMQEQGRLTLSEDQKEKGYRYRVCNVLPGNIENAKSRGYEVVTHSLVSGSGRSHQPEVNGVPTEFEVGGANGSMKAVWMRIPEKDAQILDEIEAEKAAEQEEMIKKGPGIPQDQLIGGVTKENLR